MKAVLQKIADIKTYYEEDEEVEKIFHELEMVITNILETAIEDVNGDYDDKKEEEIIDAFGRMEKRIIANIEAEIEKIEDVNDDD